MRRSPFLLVLLAFVVSAFQIRPVSAQDEETTGSRKVVAKVVPKYPEIARSMNLTGTVKLAALVLANGTVKSIDVKGGNPLLVQSAQRAVQEWKWEKTDHESTEEVEFRFHP
jgi:TonB family protein